ncbi:hypothetical protein PPERSA_00477 [Pseudocohnilembus persalinus]|uniref:Transmembrane protein n=1 Tax=Pseudocohnilembus persalinus TaxID=266149 RepID=A0A0V0QHX0_PSEPJ|nr:hypothetical protein PPERSA_00477 [Pseudocohnilembus persalinus]|eukprot:KRX01855.1 hypothetical protein PPERSA_00477 [Pseudocohnilembus persalinus]
MLSEQKQEEYPNVKNRLSSPFGKRFQHESQFQSVNPDNYLSENINNYVSQQQQKQLSFRQNYLSQEQNFQNQNLSQQYYGREYAGEPVSKRVIYARKFFFCGFFRHFICFLAIYLLYHYYFVPIKYLTDNQQYFLYSVGSIFLLQIIDGI